MPDTLGGATNLAPSMRRSPWFRAVCRYLNLNPDVHRDRILAVEHALRLAAELLAKALLADGLLASATTELLVAAGQTAEGERGARQKLERAWARYRAALDEQE